MSSSAGVQKCPRGLVKIRPTDRDIKVLHALFESTVMSFEQLRIECFAGLAHVTAYNRLSELSAAGLVDTLRIGNIVYQQNPRIIGNIYRVSKSGLRLLRSRLGVERITRDDPFPWNTTQLAHDLILNEMGRVFRESATCWQFKNGKHFTQTLAEERRVPDALLQESGTKECMALELELTVKSEKRYREILLGYKLSREISKVLYVSNDPGVLRKVQSVLTGGKILGTKLERSVGKFYFATMTELMAPDGRELILSLISKTDANTQEVRA